MATRGAAGIAVPVVLSLMLAACGSGSSSPGASAPAGGVSPGASAPAGSSSPGASGAAGGAPLAASGELSVMGFGCREGDDIATNRIAEFEAAYPDIALTCVEGGLDDQQFLTAVQSGDPPDLVYFDRAKLGTFASQGVLQPLEDCVSRAGIDMANLREAAVDQVTLDGTLYGIPEFFNVVVLVLNDTVLKEAGVSADEIDTGSWDRLRAANEKMLKKDGAKITRFGFDPKLPEFLPLWAKINGVEILSPDGKTSNLDDPKVAEALTFARDLIAAHGEAPDFFAARDAVSADFFGAGNPIATDVLGGVPIEQFFLNVMAGTSPDVDITVKAPTTVDGEDVTYATGLTWAIPQGAKNPDAACAMAATMTHADTWISASTKRAEARKAENKPYTGTYTANKAADEEIFGSIVDLSAMPDFEEAVKVAIAVSDKAFSIPATGGSVDFEKAWRDAVNRVLNEGADPAAALAEADQVAQDALDAGGT
jgi:multiple sugar transport system substrate-binding protein